MSDSNPKKKSNPNKMQHLNECEENLEEIKLLNENEIKYDIYVLNEGNGNGDIVTFYQEMLDYIEKLNGNYIWNNEKFNLNRPQPLNDTCSVCSGTLDFGDNLEDEWFVVYLIVKLSTKFSKRLCAQVKDYDGEFLLIHVANFLPQWASSAANNCMDNRVFIYNGQLHIIPPATNPSQVTYLPASGSIDTGYSGAKIVFDFTKLTAASADIQQCLIKRLDIFNETSLLMHRATCILPAKLVWLLKSNPSLISLAINKFCEKDPADLKLCSQFQTFKPVDLVNYRVSFTKHLYGKLKYSDYKPEKRHDWPSLYSLIATLGTNSSSESLVRERSLLGFKLTCAFEIMSQHVKVDTYQDNPFESYVERLKSVGYFKDYLENSKNYIELIEKAKEDFNNSTNNTQKSTCQAKPISKSSTKYPELLDSFYDDLTKEGYVVKLKEEIYSEQEKEKDDSDEWLCVEAPQLDDYLDMYSRGEVSSAYDFRVISNAFKKFLRIPPKNKNENLLEGVNYENIEHSSEEKLIDFNVESIEKNLKDFLKIDSDLEKNNPDIDNDDENDSFYEVDDDLLEDEENDDDEDRNKNIKSLMELMDDELKMQKDLSRIETQPTSITNSNSEDLDIDLNLVTNALESYSSQLGFTGPVSNILKSMGL
jgi:hypothetical protein